jgi:linoleoyl-CoA desaturase
LHHTYTNIPGHDEDLDAGRIIRFTKDAKWHSFHRFQQYYSVFLYGLLTFNWAITTDFRQMRTYLKENYPTVKRRAQNTLDDFDNHKSDLRFHLDRTTYSYRYAWWKVLIGFFIMHYTAGLILKHRISIGTRCGRDR